MTNYQSINNYTNNLNRFGFTQEEIEQWKDKPHLLEGKDDNNIALIMIHGWSSTPSQFLPIAKKLNKERGYEIIIPLLSGHGTKPEDLEKFGWKDWLEDVVKEIDKVKKKSSSKKIFLVGISMGGNLAILAAVKKKIDGIILIGTPVHLKLHFWIWLGLKFLPFFKKYFKKNYPKNVIRGSLKNTSYQYFPAVSVKRCLETIRRSVFSLPKVEVPILIFQTNHDYLIAKYSSWLIYNSVKSKFKKLEWIKIKNDNHTLNQDEVADVVSSSINFIEKIMRNNIN